MLVISLGGGGVFVGVTTAANARVGEEKAGLGAGLLNTGRQVGTALGLAVLCALATARATALLRAGHDTVPQRQRTAMGGRSSAAP